MITRALTSACLRSRSVAFSDREVRRNLSFSTGYRSERIQTLPSLSQMLSIVRTGQSGRAEELQFQEAALAAVQVVTQTAVQNNWGALDGLASPQCITALVSSSDSVDLSQLSLTPEDVFFNFSTEQDGNGTTDATLVTISLPRLGEMSKAMPMTLLTNPIQGVTMVTNSIRGKFVVGNYKFQRIGVDNGWTLSELSQTDSPNGMLARLGWSTMGGALVYSVLLRQQYTTVLRIFLILVPLGIAFELVVAGLVLTGNLPSQL